MNPVLLFLLEATKLVGDLKGRAEASGLLSEQDKVVLREEEERVYNRHSKPASPPPGVETQG